MRKISSSLLKPFLRNSTQSCHKQYFRPFSRYNFKPEVDNDVLSSVAVEYVSMDVHVKFDDSSSNSSRDSQGTDFVSNEWARPKPITKGRKALQAFPLKKVTMRVQTVFTTDDYLVIKPLQVEYPVCMTSL